MFDPKMDTGLLHGLPELPFDPAEDLSADEACWIMDEMMATEVCRFALARAHSSSHGIVGPA
jgi:hypothetical protein